MMICSADRWHFDWVDLTVGLILTCFKARAQGYYLNHIPKIRLKITGWLFFFGLLRLRLWHRKIIYTSPISKSYQYKLFLENYQNISKYFWVFVVTGGVIKWRMDKSIIVHLETVCYQYKWCVSLYPLKVLWIFKNIFETLHDLNDGNEKNRILKTPSKNSNRVKIYSSFKIMQISI